MHTPSIVVSGRPDRCGPVGVKAALLSLLSASALGCVIGTDGEFQAFEKSCFQSLSTSLDLSYKDENISSWFLIPYGTKGKEFHVYWGSGSGTANFEFDDIPADVSPGSIQVWRPCPGFWCFGGEYVDGARGFTTPSLSLLPCDDGDEDGLETFNVSVTCTATTGATETKTRTNVPAESREDACYETEVMARSALTRRGISSASATCICT